MNDWKLTAVYPDEKEEVFSTGIETRELYYSLNHDNLEKLIVDTGEHEFGVNLRTGYFKLSDNCIIRFDLGNKVLDNTKRKLIYFKSDNYLALGWQVTIDGINYQRILKIDRDGVPTFKTKN